MQNLGCKIAAKATMLQNRMSRKVEDLKALAKKEQDGAVAFEYIIILVLMVAIIVAAFIILRPVIVSKAQEIATFVGGVNIQNGTIPGM